MDPNLARAKVTLTNFLVVTTILSGAVPKVFGQQGSESKTIPVIMFDEVPFLSQVWNLCETAGINYILDPRTETNYSRMSARWQNLTAIQALDRVLATNGLKRVENSASTVTRITFTNAATQFVNPTWIKADTSGPTPRIQMSYVSLRHALTNLAGSAQLQLEFDSRLLDRKFSREQSFDLTRDVNFRWEKLTPRQALAAVCENHDLVLTANSSNNVIKLSPFVP